MQMASQVSTASVVTQIFDEDDYTFSVFGRPIHYRLMALMAGVFGFGSVCLVFTLTLFKFTWTRYEESVDVLALIGICVFLVSGTFVHFCVLLAVKKNDMALLNPSLIFHSFLILIGVIMALTSVGELASDDIPQLDESEILARQILLVVPLIILFNSMILHVLLRFRLYLKRRRNSTGIHGTITPVLFFGDDTRLEDGNVEVKPTN